MSTVRNRLATRALGQADLIEKLKQQPTEKVMAGGLAAVVVLGFALVTLSDWWSKKIKGR